MVNDILVSIILPTYNRAHLLRRSINSVLSQEYSNFELIVIDDGSIDDTLSLIDKINDKRIRYIRLDSNQGVGNARHIGIESSNGELISFIDSDDEWLPNKLEFQIEIFKKFPQVEFQFGNFENINLVDNTKEYGFVQAKKGLSILKSKQIDVDLILITDNLPQAMLEINFFATPTIMFRSYIIKKTGNFCKNLRGAEDFEFWWRAALNNITFAYTQKPLMRRFKNNESITAGVISFISGYLTALDYCTDVAKSNNRLDLLPYLQKKRHNAWRTLLYAYAKLGDNQNSFLAFKKALKYGISIKLFAYLLISLIGKKPIGYIKYFYDKIFKRQITVS